MDWAEDELFKRLDSLFGHLALSEFAEFEAGCHGDFFMDVRGSTRPTTRLRRAEVGGWYGSMQDLAGGSFRTSVRLIFIEDSVGLVILGHAFERDGERVTYETINRCSFRGELLSACFSYPMNASDYASAWGIRGISEPQPV